MRDVGPLGFVVYVPMDGRIDGRMGGLWVSTAQRPPGWITVVRDLLSLGCAWAIVFKEAGIIFDPPAQLSEPLLWLAGAMIGVPGVGQILAFRFGGGGGGTGTGGLPSEVPRDRLSGSSSSSGGGD